MRFIEPWPSPTIAEPWLELRCNWLTFAAAVVGIVSTSDWVAISRFSRFSMESDEKLDYILYNFDCPKRIHCFTFMFCAFLRSSFQCLERWKGCLKPVFNEIWKQSQVARVWCVLHHGVFPARCVFTFEQILHHEKLSNEVLLVGLMTFWVQREAGDLPYGDSLIKIW